MYFFTGTQLSSILMEGLNIEDSAVLLQNHADQRHGFAGLAGAEEDTCAWY